jgi:colicin import membrane protein
MSAVMQEPVEQVEVPVTQTITLPVNDSLMAGLRPAGAAAEARVWEVDNPAMAQLASDQRTTWAKRIDALKVMRKDFVEPAQTILERAKKWFNPPIEDLEAGREILGTKLLAFDQTEKSRLAREQAERDALARKLRQEAEAKAAAERARAEEQAREARRKAAEAEQARLKAEADGNARGVAAAAAARAKAEEAERAAIENGEAKAQAAQLEAAAQVAAAPPVAEPVKIAGQATKTVYEAALKDDVTVDQAKLLIVEAIAAGRHDLLAHLNLDVAPRGSLNKMAAALKGSFNVPGFVARAVTSIAGARK